MITLCYIHVPRDRPHLEMARRFIDSVLANDPGCDYRTTIICQGHRPTPIMERRFRYLRNCDFYIHDDTGWDIGGYVAASRVVQTEGMMCMGGSTTVRRPGWLARMEQAWTKYGPGFYGTLSSNQIRPHFNTNGFLCAPFMLQSYPHVVTTKEQRYEFEHGKDAFWWHLNKLGFPTKLVTWDGEYDWQDFRKPDNISCRGDQSNCLTFFRINYNYDHYRMHDPVSRANLEYLTDHHILDEDFKYPNWVLSASRVV